MTNFDLPTTLNVNGVDRAINCDFRDVLTIFEALNDDELTQTQKQYVMLSNLFVDNLNELGDLKEAGEKAVWFLDWGKEYKGIEEDAPKLVDWGKDYNLIISAVNKVAQKEVRECPFLHWWTFLGYFSERGRCQYSTILEIREKVIKGKKLEKWEKEILKNNHDDIILKDDENKDFENEIFGGE